MESVKFNVLEHVCLSIVSDGYGGWSLLPWLPVYLNWHTLVYDNLWCVCVCVCVCV